VDGLRGAAILLVMLLHFGGSETDHGLARTALPIPGKVYLWIADNGACGVDLFFVLSGFLISGILFDARGSRYYFRNFYARRTLRIFPLYYGALVAVLLPLHVLSLVGHAGGQRPPADEWGLWLYCTNLVMVVRGGSVFNSGWLHLSHFWSLAVEEHFYLVWPLVIFAFGRRTSMAICVGCGVVALALRVWLLSMGAPGNTVYVLTPCRMDALALGAFLALLARGPGGERSLARWGWGLLLLGAVGAATTFALRLPGETAEYASALKYTVLALFFGGVLALCVGAPRTGVVGRFWSNPVLRFFGKYSYGLYVFHYALRPACNALFPADELSTLLGSRLLGVLAYAVLAGALSVGAAWLSWHLYEKHFLKLKRYFAYSASRG
jgi:peptidoglycan/LPS O-acetylase OafA/YrhL